MSVAAYQAKMTESAMRTGIQEAVARLGGRVFWVHDSRYAPATADLPDLILVLPRQNRVMFVELKSQYRKTTAGQREVIEMLEVCQEAFVFVVRPSPKDTTELSYDALLAWLQEV